MPCNWPRKGWNEKMPGYLPRNLRVMALQDGEWQEVAAIQNNRRRLLTLPIDVTTEAVRIVIDDTWGSDRARIFSLEAGEPDLDAGPELTEWPKIIVTGGGAA